MNADRHVLPAVPSFTMSGLIWPMRAGNARFGSSGRMSYACYVLAYAYFAPHNDNAVGPISS